MGSLAINARQLAKRIGNTTLLAPLDLIVPRGAIFALIGHNGAGKSTLIKLLLNIVQPTQGVATVLGMPSTCLRGHAFTRIGYVSENQEMPEWLTVAAFMAHLRPMYPRWDDKGLPGLQDQALPALSPLSSPQRQSIYCCIDVWRLHGSIKAALGGDLHSTRQFICFLESAGQP